MAINYKKLDNPVWYALSETHNTFSIELDGVKFYQPDYCPFGAFIKKENVPAAVNEYANLCNNFFVVGERPPPIAGLPLTNELVCTQMIIENNIQHHLMDIVELTESHAQQLYDLVNLVQPGYFRIKTKMLGNYYGIFKEGQLVAVTGERMCMKQFIEVSAVVTHPNHTGNGYAKQLVAHTVNKIIERNHIPFLHVAATNIAAINLYERLGFTTRRKISFWHFVKPVNKNHG